MNLQFNWYLKKKQREFAFLLLALICIFTPYLVVIFLQNYIEINKVFFEIFTSVIISYALFCLIFQKQMENITKRFQKELESLKITDNILHYKISDTLDMYKSPNNQKL